MKKYPLKLTYISKSAIWGGSLLSSKWGKIADGDNIAESWELSVREREMARVTDGEAAGLTLAEYFDLCGYDCVSPLYRKGDRFPLLVKLIDAHDRLSVQVHPDDAYASSVEGDSGKTELWYIVDAEEGAEIIYGLAEGKDSADLARAMDGGDIDSVMRRIPVRAGESYFIPAGTVHAIGAGILIAEIQQNSDLTYRVYDYDRRGPDGRLRELHTKKALDVVRPYTEDEVSAIRFSRGRSDGVICNSKYFKVRVMTVLGEESMRAERDSFTSLLCIGGEGYIEQGDERYAVSCGDSYFIPADMGDYRIVGGLSLICSTL